MRAILFASLVAGCSWTSFDDLGKEAWAQSTKDPSIGSVDFAVAIADTGTGVGGGQLSVLSNDSVTFDNLVYDTKGGGSLKTAAVIGAGVNVASPPALFVASSPTECTAVCAGSDGTNPTIVEYKGCAMPPATKSLAVQTPPDAAAYVGSTLVIASAAHLYVDGPSGVVDCTAKDDPSPSSMTTVAGFAGLAGTTDTLYAWTQDGKLLTYALSSLTTCPSLGTAATPVAPTAAAFATNFSAAPGATVLLSGGFVVLAGLAPSSTTGKVVVVSTGATPAIASSIDANGIASAAIGDLGGGGTYLAVGQPHASTGGQVLLYSFPSTGMLASTPDKTLADAQPDSNEQYGRSVAIMKYNSSTVLTVAAKSEVFAYFRLDPIYTMDLRE